MPRGRPRKIPLPELPSPEADDEPGEYRCSACDFVAKKFAQTEKHVLKKHYGIARINNPENTPFTDSERLAAYIRAQKLVKVLNCSQCPKSFKSGLGFKYHLDLCGKDENETMRECEICGKMLKLHSLPVHVRTMHTTPENTVTATAAVQELNKKQKLQQERNSVQLIVPAGRKRSSAIKARESFKDLSDDEGGGGSSTAKGQSSGPVPVKKYKIVKDDDFEMPQKDLEEVEAEDKAVDEEEEEDEETENEQDDGNTEEDQENEPLDDVVVIEADPAVPEVDLISPKDLDDLLIAIKSHIRRHLTRPVPNRTLATELVELEADKGEIMDPMPYKCYNERCHKQFAFRLDLENHYKKCCNMGFVFSCTGSPDCPYKNPLLNMNLFQHFYARHAPLMPTENKLAQLFFHQASYEQQVRAERRSSVAKTTAKKKASDRKSNGGEKQHPSGLVGEGFDYTREQEAERMMNYTEEWLQYLEDNSNPGSTFRCLSPLCSHWKVVSGPVPSGSIVPRFKLTKSMASGDNEFKFVPALHGQRTFTTAADGPSFTFNVGQFVCSVAWAPLPLPETTPNRRGQTSSKEDTLPPVQPNQFLAVATAPFEDTVLNVATATSSDSLKDRYSLLIWDMGPLESSSSTKNTPSSTSSTTSTFVQPRLALNITHTYGDIQDMAWCPCGSSYQPLENSRFPRCRKRNPKLSRLGLLALACEDGRIRLIAVPHPAQLPGSYDPTTRFTVEPVLVLQTRFAGCTASVNSIAWHTGAPQESLLGGLNDGTVALWRLTELANCAQNGASCRDHPRTVVRPIKWWTSPKRCPVLAVKWLNPVMFFTSHSDMCRVWHVDYDGQYSEYNRNIVQKIEAHPLWYSTVILFDMALNRSNNMIVMKTFGNDEYSVTGSKGAFAECTNSHSIANVAKMRINDMSLSPWMQLLAYCTENGELHTTQLLPKPFKYPKKFNTYMLYNIRLGDLIHLDVATTSGVNGESGSQPEQGQPEPGSKNASTGPKSTTTSKKSGRKTNMLINEVIDVQQSYHDFFLKYFMIFDDTQKFNLNRSHMNAKGASARPSSSLSYLTKHDLCRFYAVTSCSWNPNIQAYSWLFSATKSGLCRVASFPLVNPHGNLNTP